MKPSTFCTGISGAIALSKDCSPYMTSQIKRFGDYLIDLDLVPQALDRGMTLVF
ncbi:hypothetical protein [Microseira wollei]|uniref:Transposase, Tn3 n=1 Tax=Microseira wollei NIES-4236 TaxID=2530354 RepID=A0AAV3XH52_9CYAN|nr:hypothetical protein [Microseira wollei]GET41225.1 putative transposase, Tn3 [Microseira wollei NIES-4236]